SSSQLRGASSLRRATTRIFHPTFSTLPDGGSPRLHHFLRDWEHGHLWHMPSRAACPAFTRCKTGAAARQGGDRGSRPAVRAPLVSEGFPRCHFCSMVRYMAKILLRYRGE